MSSAFAEAVSVILMKLLPGGRLTKTPASAFLIVSPPAAVCAMLSKTPIALYPPELYAVPRYAFISIFLQEVVMTLRALLFLFLMPALAFADDFAAWQVPWEKTRPRDPAVDTAGQVWFVGQGGDYVGRLAPDSGAMTRLELPEGSGPHNVIVGNDGEGDLWIAGNRVGWIGRMNRENGKLEKFSTAAKQSTDPHTLIETQDGRIWFTAQHSNRVGVLDPDDRSLQVWEVPTKRARPYGIVLDRDDQPWIVLLGTNKLATIENGQLREIDLPREEARPRRLDVIGGRVWYVDYAAGYYGVYDPAENSFNEWRSPSGETAAPYGAIGDDDDRFWYVETGPQPNRMIGVDTSGGEVIYNAEIPKSGGAVRHMYFDAERDAIWFGMDTNYIGRFFPPADQGNQSEDGT